jgi:hypothetical protein
MFQTYVPALLSGLPIVTGLFGRKQRFTFKKLSSLLFFGWKAYTKLGPLWRSRVRHRQPDRTAAQEYLAKRI